MKPRITTLLVLFSCSLAFADVAVNFSAQSSPILKAGSSELVSENALDDDVLVQLIWSQTATGYQTDGLDLSLVNPDEFILETNTNNQFGTFSPAMVSVFTDADVGGADINAGYIYARIFDSAVPSFGSYFLEMGLQGFGLFEYDILNPSSIYTDDLNDLGGVVSIDSQNTFIAVNTNYSESYSLVISNLVGGTVSPEGSSSFAGGSQVEITATADLGYQFSGWADELGDAYAYANPAVFTVASDQTLIAQFGEDLSDEDEDGLSLYDEVITYGSDPEQGDTSGDGLLDGLLVSMGLNPTVNYSNVVATVQSSPESFGVYGADTVNELLGSITNLTDLTVAQSNELRAVQASLSVAEENLDAEIANRLLLEEEVADLTASNTALELLNDALTEQKDGLLIQVSGLESEKQALGVANETLQLSVELLTEEKQSLSELVASLQANNANLEAQVAALSTNANAALIAEIGALESTNAVLTNVVGELQVEIAALEDEVGELEWEIADLEEALEDSYVHYDSPDWLWNDHWQYPWYKPNNYWWGWGNPPARYLPRWGREATIGKKVKMKRLKKRWRNNREEEMAEIEVDILVEAAEDLTSGNWVGTTNKFMLDVPVDDADVKFYRINYN